MSFQNILNQIASRPEVEGVVFLDAEGEAVASLGRMEEEKLKLIGAYQAILLGSIERQGIARSKTIVTQCEERTVLTHNLKDGYFVCVVINRELHFAHARFLFQDLYSSLLSEL